MSLSASNPIATRDRPGRPAGVLGRGRGRPWLERTARAARSFPIRWRILAIAVLNSVLALVLLALVAGSANRLTAAWDQLMQVRRSEQLLTGLSGDAQRLQSLIHRYLNQQDPAVLGEIVERREPLISRLRVQARLDPLLADPARSLTTLTERFLRGFDELRAVRSEIADIYEIGFLRSAREMADTSKSLDASVTPLTAGLWPILDESREAFNAMLLAANSYYLSTSQEAANEAGRHAQAIERGAGELAGLARTPEQRRFVEALRSQAELVRRALERLRARFARQGELLRAEVDGNAGEMARVVQGLATVIQQREVGAQERFDRALRDVETKVALVALAFILVVVLMSLGVSKSISEPLGQLRRAMLAIVAGEFRPILKGNQPRDEIGDMARAVEVFRENAIAKHEAEEALRAAKDRAEKALSELRDMQETLVQTEKLAALGGLVAGVAHEVNNPVGISLTVATSLARRCREFAAEIEAGPLRRSRLAEFVAANQDAARQLEANLQRAGELVQSFKQVAVDRSDAERRRFDLADVVHQIVASLRPGLKTSRIGLTVEVEEGIVLDSYPGSLGQILTNLFLNAVRHAFPDEASGTIGIEARRAGPDQVAITLTDDGCGMSEEVERRAFEPFFTTRRGEGGTGLGLHIVHNLVVRQLGGRISLTSEIGRGTSFRVVLPLVAPRQARTAELAPA